jgi:hypothetical protein
MKVFSTESMWDNESQQFVEYYYIDGKEVSLDEYDEAMQNEVTEDEDDFCDGNCENCDSCEDEDDEESDCDCIDSTIHKYTQMILDTKGCPNCIEEILKDFICTIADHLEIDDEE